MDVVALNNGKKKETKTPKCLLMSEFLLVILLVFKWFRIVSIFLYFCMFRMLLPSSVTQHCVSSILTKSMIYAPNYFKNPSCVSMVYVSSTMMLDNPDID